jgi:hypothetical protein
MAQIGLMSAADFVLGFIFLFNGAVNLADHSSLWGQSKPACYFVGIGEWPRDPSVPRACQSSAILECIIHLQLRSESRGPKMTRPHSARAILSRTCHGGSDPSPLPRRFLPR